jgi:hypothetical protein
MVIANARCEDLEHVEVGAEECEGYLRWRSMVCEGVEAEVLDRWSCWKGLDERRD